MSSPTGFPNWKNMYIYNFFLIFSRFIRIMWRKIKLVSYMQHEKYLINIYLFFSWLIFFACLCALNMIVMKCTLKNSLLWLINLINKLNFPTAFYTFLSIIKNLDNKLLWIFEIIHQTILLMHYNFQLLYYRYHTTLF